MKDYNQCLETVYQGFELPSMMVGIYDQGEISYYSYGVADDRMGAAPNEKTRYMIGSTSKSFIATAVTLLAAEGKLDLDEKVRTYLPDVHFYNEDMDEKITVRMILSHQTGLPRHDVSWVNNTEISLEEMIHNIRFLPPAFEVGERFHYQNHCFALASYLVEKVSGQSWQSYIEEHIFQPLHMDRSWCDTTQFGAEGTDCARPYAKMKGQTVPWRIWPSDNMGCAASITSTAEEALRWMITNLHQGEFDGLQVIPAEAEQELHKAQMPIKEFEMRGFEMSEIGVSKASYGLGWFVEEVMGETLISHGGTVGGFRSSCGYLPEHDFAYVIFANLDNTPAVSAAEYALISAKCNKEEKDWVAIYKTATEHSLARSRAVMEPVLASISGEFCDASTVGVYEHPAYGKVQIQQTEEDKTRIWFLGAPLAMYQAANDLLVIDAMDLAAVSAPCKFVRNEAGEVQAIAIMLEPSYKDFIVYKKVS